MTDDERNDELAAEPIEDLEAPAAAQGDVAGGNCATPTCVGGTKVTVFCELPTCRDSAQVCVSNTSALVVHLH
jgi:hypothetical protein